MNHTDGRCLRQRPQFQLGFKEHPQGAFATDDQMRQIPRPILTSLTGQEGVQGVPANSPHDGWIPGGDLCHVRLDQRANAAVQLALSIVPSFLREPCFLRGRRKFADRPIHQCNPETHDILARFSVHDRARSRRVVAHHATDGGAATGGRIGSKVQARCAELSVQFITNHARLHAYPLLRCIHLKNVVHELRKVEHHPRPGRLPRKAGPATPRRDGQSAIVGDPQGGQHIGFVARQDDARRHHLIVTGIGRVDPTTGDVDQDLSAHGVPQFRFQLGGRSTPRFQMHRPNPPSREFTTAENGTHP